ncbi:MAG: hypothetical protein K9M08_10325 [Pirellula sp.]|nr:hypothetical protein [Pirellula sp.]
MHIRTCRNFLLSVKGQSTPTLVIFVFLRRIRYGPLYQADYMLGGLQLLALQKEVVQAGKKTNREFHDAILRENYLPFELLRSKMLSLPFSKEQLPAWKFYDF